MHKNEQTSYRELLTYTVNKNKNDLLIFDLVSRSTKKDFYTQLKEFPHFLQVITKYKEIPRLIPQTLEKKCRGCEIGGKVYEFKTREKAVRVGNDVNRYPNDTILKVLVKTGSNLDGVSVEIAEKSIQDRQILNFDHFREKKVY